MITQDFKIANHFKYVFSKLGKPLGSAKPQLIKPGTSESQSLTFSNFMIYCEN